LISDHSRRNLNLSDYWIDKGVIGLNGVIGCFGMTGEFFALRFHSNRRQAETCLWLFPSELAHGSNVAGVETTATFDEKTDEFVIHTPHLGATKWWIGGEQLPKRANLGKC
jgi:acyl-CoA oxidase